MSDDNKQVTYYKKDEANIESSYLQKAGVLLESLPYIKEYSRKIVVVKIGGSMMEDENILKSVLDDLVLMKYVGIKVILLHGGGKQITGLMKEKGIEAQFVDGLRVTTGEVIDLVKMVLIGSINSKLVSMSRLLTIIAPIGMRLILSIKVSKRIAITSTSQVSYASCIKSLMRLSK